MHKRYVYFRDDKEIVPSHPTVSYLYEDGVAILDIEPVTADTSGSYSVVASNAVGKASCLATIQVQGKLNC